VAIPKTSPSDVYTFLDYNSVGDLPSFKGGQTVSDTPRMQSALLDAPDAGFANIWKVGCDIERELNEAKELIKRLEVAAWKNYNNANKTKEDKP
jgi:hypothetical protein